LISTSISVLVLAHEILLSPHLISHT